MQVNKQDTHELDAQIVALRRLHQQVQASTERLPYVPSVDSIRISNLKSSKTGMLIGARATGTVRMRFSAEVVLTDDEVDTKI